MALRRRVFDRGEGIGLYKFGTSYYQPTVGRWTQPDPSRLDGNPFVYAGDNPINFVDPSGLVTLKGVADTADAVSAGISLLCLGGVGCSVSASAKPLA